MALGLLFSAAAGWFFLSATPRAEGPLRGWRGTALGLIAAALAVWPLRAAGAGLAEAVAEVLAMAILVVPGWSYLRARRRRMAASAAR
ncbi:hypothetical protein FVQ98_07745 [Ottowia sp. GY511]|uniref:DUF2484 family protein n=1 Tax=Ottowia flava TaxID=2675430 RepID=A0ABW4KWQ1_9BURK|nr:hypothetical protein [Ottowia sp. GY511]TXK29768.1 hypothetical protein FVQ98_07745 [Ottowia sp. GY511]